MPPHRHSRQGHIDYIRFPCLYFLKRVRVIIHSHVTRPLTPVNLQVITFIHIYTDLIFTDISFRDVMNYLRDHGRFHFRFLFLFCFIFLNSPGSVLVSCILLFSVIYLFFLVHSTKNRELSWCQICRPWWHQINWHHDSFRVSMFDCSTVHSSKYAYGFVVLCFVWVYIINFCRSYYRL